VVNQDQNLSANKSAPEANEPNDHSPGTESQKRLKQTPKPKPSKKPNPKKPSPNNKNQKKN
jgi:hypothetical protein